MLIIIINFRYRQMGILIETRKRRIPKIASQKNTYISLLQDISHFYKYNLDYLPPAVNNCFGVSIIA